MAMLGKHFHAQHLKRYLFNFFFNDSTLLLIKLKFYVKRVYIFVSEATHDDGCIQSEIRFMIMMFFHEMK